MPGNLSPSMTTRANILRHRLIWLILQGMNLRRAIYSRQKLPLRDTGEEKVTGNVNFYRNWYFRRADKPPRGFGFLVYKTWERRETAIGTAEVP